MPVVNLRLYDNRLLALGAYHLKRAPQADERVLFVYGESDIVRFYADYWEELWNSAIPLLDTNLEKAEYAAFSLPDMTSDRWAKVKRAIRSEAPDEEFKQIFES